MPASESLRTLRRGARSPASRRSRGVRWALAALATLALGCPQIEDPSLSPPHDPAFDAPPPAKPLATPSAERQVFWGDLHIHTAYSFDAYTMGVRALPDDAYTYAKGGTIEHGFGYPIRASRPLDFAAVTDHAEYLGVARHQAREAGEDENALRDAVRSGNRLRITWNAIDVLMNKMGTPETRQSAFGVDGMEDVSKAAWREIVAAAERNNDPGRFTAFVAYEWSSMPKSENLHRNVVYRTADVPELPVSSLASQDPEDLWAALGEQRAQGMEAIAIPHNANVSNGRMYDEVRFDGSPLDADYARTRMRWEPISEIFQIKGQSETHPELSAEDRFARFDLYDQVMSTEGRPSQPEGSYARHALRRGLELEAKGLGNPYRFGVIGSSDSHNASTSVEEDRHHGKLPMLDGSAGLRLGKTSLLPADRMPQTRYGSAGLAAVWAEENTRDSIFEAFRRKETFATSGPRMAVRLFAGFDFGEALLTAPDRLARAYALGVPMGGTLAARDGRTPRLLVLATKDPRGANLDRIQIVKGWIDPTGHSHEAIFDVAASDGRVPDAQTHRVGPLETTVDVANASYTNTVGARILETLWTDPDFDPNQKAFYYARVLEIATPRYTTYDAKTLGVPAPEPAEHQERAVTSAIFYEP